MSGDRHSKKGFERSSRLDLDNLTSQRQAPQRMYHFKIYQVGSVQFPLGKKRGKFQPHFGELEPLEQGRRINDDHRPSRIALMVSAEDSFVLMGFIFFTIRSHSSIVGCSAVFATSRRI